MDQEMLARLRRTLVERLDEGDLRDLCFDLGTDYNDLPGETRADRARELILYFMRRNRLPKLIRTIEENRPDIDLSDIPFDTDADTIWITTGEGIDLTGYGSGFLRRLAKEGRVRSQKLGRRWFFDQEVLLAYRHGWIGTEEASEMTDYTIEHIRWLAREGVVEARKVSGIWLLHEDSLLAYASPRGRT